MQTYKIAIYKRQDGSRRLLGAGFMDDDIIRIGIGDHRESQLLRREFTPFGFENKNVRYTNTVLCLISLLHANPD